MPRKKFKRGDLVQVDWGDAHSQQGWKDVPKEGDDHAKAFPCTLIGAVSFDGKKGITLCLGFAKDGQTIGYFFVPRGMIWKTKLLVPKSKIKTCY